MWQYAITIAAALAVAAAEIAKCSTFGAVLPPSLLLFLLLPLLLRTECGFGTRRGGSAAAIIFSCATIAWPTTRFGFRN